MDIDSMISSISRHRDKINKYSQEIHKKQTTIKKRFTLTVVTLYNRIRNYATNEKCSCNRKVGINKA